ncbi:chromate transport protein ChrA [Desulfosporosinus orientis DSM 765]|uniref:Chromate transport protein ChrA n=1 Tax=Desulfosporosinus orientis (strain ATCC 19365 / DSM 765 / NCIMB 8382 / VKM B-1628 / Singapore I) TaxID=768706 RepID=G7W9K9_DESOD|nr:chromate transporter [Desulfosporosinus orientis]AET69926.1 chromate transport protein ChrA [Desulfosporosinus orientis DSM 765]
MKLVELFLVFFKIGAVSFGGGYAMIPFFETEMVSHNWVSLADYIKVIAIAQVIPGPFAVDSSSYIGFQVAGILGAVLATIALCLPSFIASVVITKFYAQFKTNKYVNALLMGVRPAVLGLLISAAYIIGIKPLYLGGTHFLSLTMLKTVLVIGAGYYALSQKKVKIGTLTFLAASAVVGIILY